MTSPGGKVGGGEVTCRGEMTGYHLPVDAFSRQSTILLAEILTHLLTVALELFKSIMYRKSCSPVVRKNSFNMKYFSVSFDFNGNITLGFKIYAS